MLQAADSELAGPSAGDKPSDRVDVHGRACDFHCHHPSPVPRNDDRRKASIARRCPAISVVANVMGVYHLRHGEN